MGHGRVVKLVCPFDGEECEFPDGKHFEDENFVGCKVVGYEHGNEVVYWICHRFPVNMSITAVREAFMRLGFEERV